MYSSPLISNTSKPNTICTQQPVQVSLQQTPEQPAGTTKVPSVQVQFTAGSAFQQYANEIAQDELNHVRFLRSTLSSLGVTPGSLGRRWISHSLQPWPPQQASRVRSTPSPIPSFLVGAFVFEDVGVTAYHGAAGALSTTSTGKTILGAAAQHQRRSRPTTPAEVRHHHRRQRQQEPRLRRLSSYASALLIRGHRSPPCAARSALPAAI